MFKRLLCGLLCLILIVPSCLTFAQEVDPATGPMVIPIVESVAVIPVTEPAEVPISAPNVEPIAEPEVAPVIEAVVAPIVDPVTDPVENPIAEITGPLVGPAVEPMAEPLGVPTIVPADLPIAESAVEPVMAQDVKPMADPISLQVNSQLVINEVMAGTEINPDKDSWVELLNQTDVEISLAGWQIRGITEGGGWISLEGDAIPPRGFFWVSYYTNSRYSALGVAPSLQKSSLLFPNSMIKVELKNPDGQIVDTAALDRGSESDYRSFERESSIGDGTMATSWKRADCRRNIKEIASRTFGSPGAPNCQEPFAQNSVPYATTDSASEIPPEPVQDGVSNQPNRPPLPVIRTQRGTGGMDLNVTAEDSSDPDGDRLSYTWVFENGSTDNRENPSEYHFSEPGEKNVMLTVTDEHGIGASASIVYVATLPTVVVARSVQIDTAFSAKSYNSGDVVIASVFPNPVGKDEGQEVVVLRNRKSEPIDLTGWKFENSKGTRSGLPEKIIGSESSIEFRGSEIGFFLVNAGDQITLLDPAGNRIDTIAWGECKEGEVVLNPSLLEKEALVTKVVDGDTFHALIDEKEWSVRLIGVDAPETVHPNMAPQPFGQEASDFLRERLEGQVVRLEFEGNKTDVYGRLLAYVSLDGIMVNAELLEKGFTRAYLKFPFRLQDEFQKIEAMAKAAKVGLWAFGAASKTDSKTAEQPEWVETEDKKGDLLSEVAMPAVSATCPEEGLEIDSIMPNVPKGGGAEWIRLRNPTDQPICLKGWSLDDRTDGGSKSFAIRGGAIAPGAFRTFRKTETGLSLNNENDCATLISPNGKTADAICYSQAHSNEIITHLGGNWEPKTKAKKGVATMRKKAKTPKSEPVPLGQYLKALSTEELEGSISEIDMEKKTLYLVAKIPVSFAGSPVDMASVAQMVDLGSQVTVDLRLAGETRELVAIRQNQPHEPVGHDAGKAGVEWELALVFLLLVASALILGKRIVDKTKTEK